MCRNSKSRQTSGAGGRGSGVGATAARAAGAQGVTYSTMYMQMSLHFVVSPMEAADARVNMWRARTHAINTSARDTNTRNNSPPGTIANNTSALLKKATNLFQRIDATR